MDAQFLGEVQALASALDQLDYYGILKIPQSATPDEIKAAYYRESRAYHPDRFAAAGSPELSGFVGRYIYTAAPRTLDGAEVSVQELQARLASADQELAAPGGSLGAAIAAALAAEAPRQGWSRLHCLRGRPAGPAHSRRSSRPGNDRH